MDWGFARNPRPAWAGTQFWAFESWRDVAENAHLRLERLLRSRLREAQPAIASERRERLAKAGGEGGIRTPVPLTRQDAFEAPPLRPLRYLSDWDN